MVNLIDFDGTETNLREIATMNNQRIKAQQQQRMTANAVQQRQKEYLTDLASIEKLKAFSQMPHGIFEDVPVRKVNYILATEREIVKNAHEVLTRYDDDEELIFNKLMEMTYEDMCNGALEEL